MSTATVTRSTDKPDPKALMTLTLAKLRDVVDDFDDLPRARQRAALEASAAYLADLRAAGVIR